MVTACRQPGTASSLPAPWPGACPHSTPQAAEKRIHIYRHGGGQSGACRKILSRGALALALLPLLGLQLCQPHASQHGTQPAGVLGSLWLSLSSGTIKPDIPLGPKAGSTQGKMQLHRELLHKEKKAFTRKFPLRKAARFPGWKWRQASLRGHVCPCTPGARWAGGARICTGIYSPAEGTLFFLSGLDALQEQFRD